MPITGDYAPSPSAHAREQVALYESTDGAQGNTMKGRPVVIVTTLGARSGKVRKIPLMRVEHQGTYAVVASMGGAPKNPVWYYNLKANPRVELQDLTEKHEYVSREVTGEEKAVWWERAVAAYPEYAEYQKHTGRSIPVFVLERADG